MTEGLVLLLAWGQYGVLVGLLLYFVLRRSRRDPLAEAERRTAEEP